eukprot:TRINITY_DN4879_c0_g1_i1.p1 TRINITY_DN4879_c0_g1~~TRINITY_DN4879_c0_g1_i1.p1  ORF type:complete len:214 (+),score=35.61 TRINITY_DN4879_c0_g1_i1:144-785(+)
MHGGGGGLHVHAEINLRLMPQLPLTPHALLSRYIQLCLQRITKRFLCIVCCSTSSALHIESSRMLKCPVPFMLKVVFLLVQRCYQRLACIHGSVDPLHTFTKLTQLTQLTLPFGSFHCSPSCRAAFKRSRVLLDLAACFAFLFASSSAKTFSLALSILLLCSKVPKRGSLTIAVLKNRCGGHTGCPAHLFKRDLHSLWCRLFAFFSFFELCAA